MHVRLNFDDVSPRGDRSNRGQTQSGRGEKGGRLIRSSTNQLVSGRIGELFERRKEHSSLGND